MPAIQFIGNLIYVAIAVVGGLRVAAGAMTLGNVQAFIQYSRQFTQPLAQLASVANVLQSGVASAERVFELLDAPRPDRRPGRRRRSCPRRLRGEVRFEDVAFRYKPDVPLIDALSLVAAPGQTIAIVGPTGAGKTTLVNLIMRFYELDGGRDHARRRRPRDAAAPRGARPDRHGASGHVAVRRHDPRQHRATATRPRPSDEQSSPPRARPTSTASCARCPPATTP